METVWGNARRSPAALVGKKVLIVEDEVIVAFNMECEIEDAGGAVIGPVYSVAEARGMLNGIDVAVLDININGEQVWPVAEELRTRGVPFVIASANCHDPEAIPAAFADVPRFDKPVAMDRLIARIAELASPMARSAEKV